jgi:hypothetical protein
MKISKVRQSVLAVAAMVTLSSALSIAPTHAAGAVRSVTECTPQTDSRSADNWSSVVSRNCISDYAGAHARIEAECWKGQTIGWSRTSCNMGGDLEIRKGDQIIESIESFGFWVGEDGGQRIFRFNCAGHGEYTFTTKRVGVSLPDGYNGVDIPDRSVTVTMC